MSKPHFEATGDAAAVKTAARWHYAARIAYYFSWAVVMSAIVWKVC